jgi:hypothetical protein
MKQMLFFRNSKYLYDFIAKNNLSQKALQNATFIIFAHAGQNKIYYTLFQQDKSTWRCWHPS